MWAHFPELILMEFPRPVERTPQPQMPADARPSELLCPSRTSQSRGLGWGRRSNSGRLPEEFSPVLDAVMSFADPVLAGVALGASWRPGTGTWGGEGCQRVPIRWRQERYPTTAPSKTGRSATVTEMPSGEIILYQRETGESVIEVRLDADTVWLSQQQIADLFQTSRTNIVEHIRHVYEEGELDPAATCRDFRQVRTEGSRQVSRELPFYNLDLIISVGYRVKSRLATQFRIWATERLREYLVKGFAMDDAKLKNLGGGTYWRELLDRIRDIRSSEKVLYRQVLDLYATSVDYNPQAEETVEFFKVVQNKLHYAAHGHTAAEVVASRADAAQPNMGLTAFAGTRPVKTEIGIAKNYLSENELKKLNTLVSAYFDAAEFRAQNHQATYMRDWIAHLDRIITAMEAPTLSGAGSVSHKQAVAKAESEYEKYRAQLDATPSDVESAYLESVRRAQRAIEGKNS